MLFRSDSVSVCMYDMVMYVYVNVWVGVSQVGSYFVGQYYQVLQQQPDLVHQFYSDGSTMIRVDGDSTESANEMLVMYCWPIFVELCLT